MRNYEQSSWDDAADADDKTEVRSTLINCINDNQIRIGK